jgi:hemolysin D
MNIQDREPNDDRQSADAPKVAKRQIQPLRRERQVEQPQTDRFEEETSFGQSVMYQQSPKWSRAIVWTLVAVTTGTVAWAALAKTDEAVSATGKLEPMGKVKEVQVPVGGVVQQVFVKDGDKVVTGQKLLRLESTIPQSQLVALKSNKDALEEETRFYRALLNPTVAANAVVNPTNARAEVLALAKSRSSLIAENQLYRAELNGGNISGLDAEQKQRLASSRSELNSRLASGKLEIDQINQQAKENLVQRQGAETLLTSSQQMVKNIEDKANAKSAQLTAQMEQNRIRHANAKKILVANQSILKNVKPAGDAGALSRNQVLRQEQEVITRQGEVDELDREYSRLQQESQEVLANARMEAQNQRQQIGQRQTELDRLKEEASRLALSSNQGQEKLKNSLAVSQKDLQSKIADNSKRIAEIDGQLNKIIIENEKRLAEVNSQISQASVNLKYQEISAPVNGTIFEMKASNPGFVANNSEPVLKIVPDDKLTAKVYITNKDIGFVKVGMPVDVRIDTFSFTEFGDIKGKIVSIGSDALPADRDFPYERFPVKIEIEKQSLNVKGKAEQLQSGMSLNANIKIRERTILSIFTDVFVKQGDSIKNIRSGK